MLEVNFNEHIKFKTEQAEKLIYVLYHDWVPPFESALILLIKQSVKR